MKCNLNLQKQILCSVFRKYLSVFGTIWLCECTVLTIYFMKSKSRSSIFSENVLFTFEMSGNNVKYLMNFIFLNIDHMH